MVAMNAADQARTLALAQAIASVAALFRGHFPDARANLNPWRDDPLTRAYGESETLDLSFHFPGWNPRIQCRSVLVQLRLAAAPAHGEFSLPRRPPLLGVTLRGLTYEAERWQLATVGDWRARGSHPPSTAVEEVLRRFCHQLFELFDTTSASSASALFERDGDRDADADGGHDSGQDRGQDGDDSVGPSAQAA
jgi:hypothetical protein